MAKASIQKMAKIVNKVAPATLPKPVDLRSDSRSGDIPELATMDNGIPELDDIQKKYFTKSQVEDINAKLTLSRANRVRAALFPETLADPDGVPFVQSDPGRPPAIELLAEPSRQLKDAIVEIINYQIDVDFAQKFAPEITKLLADADRDVVRNAAELSHDLSKSEAACFVMTKSPELVKALIEALGAAKEGKEERKMKEAATGTLFNLSGYDQGRMTLFMSGGIPLLVKLLGSPAEKVVFYATSTLHKLLEYQDGAKAAVRAAGGIQKMVALLKWKDSKFLSVNADCLQILTFGDAEAKLAVWNSKGPRDVVNIVHRNRDEKLQWTASRLLRVLSTCPHNKVSIVEAGGFSVLSQLLEKERNPKLFQNYLAAMRNLSDAEIKFHCDDTLIRSVITLLEDPNLEVAMYASCIVANLTAERADVKNSILRVGGIQVLLRVLQLCRREDTAEPLLRTLRHLTSETRLSDPVNVELRRRGGLESAAQMLQIWTAWPVVKAACDLVRNLVAWEDNQMVLVDLKVIPRLGQILALSVKEDTRARREQALEPEGVQQQERRGLVDGVVMSDVMESTVSALNTLSSTSMVFRDSIDDLGVRPLLKKLLHDGQLEYDVDTAARNLLESLGGSIGDSAGEPVAPPRSASLRRGEEDDHQLQQQVYEEIPAEYETVVEQRDLRRRMLHGSTQLEVREENGAPSTPTRSSSLRSSGRSAGAAAAAETQWEDSEV